jgi:hypothetical protein
MLVKFFFFFLDKVSCTYRQMKGGGNLGHQHKDSGLARQTLPSIVVLSPKIELALMENSNSRRHSVLLQRQAADD